MVRYDFHKGVTKIKTKTFIAISSLGLLLGGGGMSLAVFGSAHAALPPTWDVSGTYVFDYNDGNQNLHDMTLVQASDGSLSGSGGAYHGTNPYTYPWTIDTGSVSGNTINYTAHYTATVVCSYSLTGTIASDGSMSGTWTDNCAGLRNGTWATTEGHANLVYANHGSYVSTQADKQAAAQSRVGMPVQSKGHN